MRAYSSVCVHRVLLGAKSTVTKVPRPGRWIERTRIVELHGKRSNTTCNVCSEIRYRRRPKYSNAHKIKCPIHRHTLARYDIPNRSIRRRIEGDDRTVIFLYRRQGDRIRRKTVRSGEYNGHCTV